MKLTATQLRRIIAEEVKATLREEVEIFPNEVMVKLPQMLQQAHKSAEQNMRDHGNNPHAEEYRLVLTKMKELIDAIGVVQKLEQ
jgi:hypothetical protein